MRLSSTCLASVSLSALAFALSVALPQRALAAPNPAVARTEQMISAFKKVKAGAPVAANAPIFSEIDALISYDAITARALEPRAGKLTPAQKRDVQQKLHELIRLIAYPDSGDFFRRAKLTFKAVKIDGSETQVPFVAKLLDEDLEVEVTLHWVKEEDGNLRVVDVSFDGDSLVQDYQNQFSRIIDKEGVRGLFEKLEERRATVHPGASRAAGKVPATGKRTPSP